MIYKLNLILKYNFIKLIMGNFKFFAIVPHQNVFIT